MAVYYHKLWKILKDRNMTQTDLANQVHISASTITKMRQDEYVSVEILSRICERLNCDYGDIITSVSSEGEATDEMSRMVQTGEITPVGRNVLKQFMTDNNLSIAKVSEITTLSVNTIKSYLNGGEISSKSYIKLMRLGKEFNIRIGEAFSEAVGKSVKKRNYCATNGKKCWADRTQWLPDKQCYEPYCAFDFERHQDEDGHWFTYEKCPRPTSSKKLDEAAEIYPYKYRGNVKVIPAKKKED